MVIMAQKQNINTMATDGRPTSTDCQHSATADRQLTHGALPLNPHPSPAIQGNESCSSAPAGQSKVEPNPIVRLFQKLPTLDLDLQKRRSLPSPPCGSKLLAVSQAGNSPERASSAGSSQRADGRAFKLLPALIAKVTPGEVADTDTSTGSSTASQPLSGPTVPSDRRQEDVVGPQNEQSPAGFSAQRDIHVKQCRLLGCWKLEASENWDFFLKEAGLGVVLRKISREMTSSEEIALLGNRWRIKMLSPLKNFEHLFRLNEDFEEENFDGKRVKAVASLDETGTTLTIRQTALESEGLELIITRQLQSDDRMIQTVTSIGTGTTAKRYFVRTAADTSQDS